MLSFQHTLASIVSYEAGWCAVMESISQITERKLDTASISYLRLNTRQNKIANNMRYSISIKKFISLKKLKTCISIKKIKDVKTGENKI